VVPPARWQLMRFVNVEYVLSVAVWALPVPFPLRAIVT
jgi:hypothetical protein